MKTVWDKAVAILKKEWFLLLMIAAIATIFTLFELLK